MKQAGQSGERRLYEAECAYKEAKDAFLLDRGWVHSCKHPDSVWRWSKTFDVGDERKVYRLDTDSAVDLEYRAGTD